MSRDALPGPAGAAWLAARLFAIDPVALGGIVVRGGAGPVRDRWLADLRAAMPPQAPWRRIPLHVDDERLLGGIDLAATLRTGRPVAQRGLLAESDGGVAVLSMAERAAPGVVAQVAAALDRGAIERTGDAAGAPEPARFGVIVLDESAEDDAPVGEALRDRCAFDVDLREIAWHELDPSPGEQMPSDAAEARALYPAVTADRALVEALCAAALALGATSMRASLLALRVARMVAASAGRRAVDEADAALAARLVLGPRATRMPASSAPADGQSDDEGAEEDPRADDDRPLDDAPTEGPDERNGPTDPTDPNDPTHASDPAAESLDDRLLTAAAATIPAGLLARLAALDAGSTMRSASGRAGAAQGGGSRGRSTGLRRERPRGGARLDLVATLRAAVPWQRVRGRDGASLDSGTSIAAGRPQAPAPLRIRADDLHVRRFSQRRRTTTVFAVDASGSSALHRLAEAKGAVELLLGECYVRRDSVAVIAFRDRSAALLLPPTRSLVRAKRSLAALPGGGGTPLAAGLDAARELAAAVRRRGETPVVVVLSDGRANIDRDGRPGRPRAEADALAAARAIRAEMLTTLFIDISAQPYPLARDLAAAMAARYLPLPHAEAATLSAAVRGAAAQGGHAA